MPDNDNIAHLKKALLAISNFNQLTLKETDPEKLIERAAAILTGTLGYINAWIALLDENGKAVTMTAAAGFSTGFEPMRMLLQRGEFPACMRTALIQDTTVVMEDAKVLCPDCPLSPEYKGRAGLTQRLAFGNRIYGILTVSVPAAYARDAEEQYIFNEVAGNLAVALQKMEATKTLRDRERYLTAIMETTQDGFWAVNRDGWIVDANEAYCRMSGYTKDELLGMHVRDQDAMDAPAEIAARIARITKNGSELFETRHRRKDGSLFDVEISVTYLNQGDGQFLCFCRDITGRKQTEKQILQLTRLYATLSQVNQMIVRIKEHDELYQMLCQVAMEYGKFNMAWVGLVDRSIGKVTPIAHAGDGENYLQALNININDPITGQGPTGTAIRTGQIVVSNDIHSDAKMQPWRSAARQQGFRSSVAIPFRLKGETIGALNLYSSELGFFNAPEEIHLLEEIGLDVSFALDGFAVEDERKRAEGALRETAMKLKATVKAGHVGLWDCDLTTNKAFYSAEWKSLIGYGEDEIGDSLEEWKSRVHPDDLKRTWDTTNSYMASGLSSYEIEHRLHHRDGTYRWVLVQASIMRDEAGHPVKLLGSQVDITERKRAEDALHESEERFRTLVAGAPDGIFVQSEGRFLFINPAMTSLLGVTKYEDLLGTEIMERINPEYHEAIRDRIRFQRETGTSSLPMEQEFLRVDGSRVFVETTAVAIRFQGRDAHLVFVRDITMRKQANEALQRSERNYREIFNATSEAVFLSDAATKRILDLNNAALSIFGYDLKEEILALNIWDLMSIEPYYYTRDEALHHARLTIEQGPQVFVWPSRKKNGDRFWTEVSLRSTLIGGEGCILTVIRDITERKRADAERERLMAAIEQAAETIFITDPEGIVQYVNPAFERVTGYHRDEILGQNPRLLKSGEHDEAFYTDIWQTLMAGRTWEGRLINRRKDGTLYTEEASISPVRDPSGTIVSYVAVKHDITRELETEQQLLQAQKMESVGRLAGGVAHDINNMLMVILSYAEMCRDKMPDHNARKWLDEIVNASQRSVDITRQLLAFARRQTISPKVLDLNDTVSKMLKLLRRLIGENIHLVWVPGANLWPVKLDPSQVDQILANLCVNARDAIGSTGKVIIETENVTLDAAYCASHVEVVPGDYVLLTVSDNGCGMEKDVLMHIFEPFFTTKGIGEGTGLGLATVYGIVKQNNGSTTVHSEPGKGTTFNIYLPRLVGEAAKMADTEVKSPPRGQGETILLVEDELLLRATCTLLLDSLGYNVLEAETSAAALEMLARMPDDIDLLLTDVVMPDMNGLQLAEQLRAIKPGIKVLFMSGYTANVIGHYGALEENAHFIGKPFSRDDLARKLQQVLEAK